jgi:hypothetical protein
MVGNAGSTKGRLLARPAADPTGEARATGFLSLDPGAPAREGYLLYVPEGYGASRPSPMVVLLHGAGGDARTTLNLLRRLADAVGVILLAPTSHEYTWDVILGGYGPDVKAIDRALKETFSRYAVDPARLAIGGSPTGPPTCSRWGSTTATASPTCWPSRLALWCRMERWAPRAFSSPTARATTCRRSSGAAAGSCPGCGAPVTR